MKRITFSLFFVISLSLFVFAQNDPLDFGNPDNAVANPDTSPNKLLVRHTTFTLSYNKSRGAANWVAWHLDSDILGPLPRPESEPFAPDTLLPVFLTTIDKIEQATGLDFLSNLSDDIENAIESKKSAVQ